MQGTRVYTSNLGEVRTAARWAAVLDSAIRVLNGSDWGKQLRRGRAAMAGWAEETDSIH